MKKFETKVVKYTVSLDNLKKGTITAVEQPEIKVGDYEKNVQFVDKNGNNMGRNGRVTKILKIETVG